MRLLNTSPHDAVTELLASLRMRSTVYCLSELRAPWGFEVDGANVPKFHLVLAGSSWLSLAGREPIQLQAGDLVSLIPLVLQIDSRSADSTTWLEPVFALMRQEADRVAPGAQAIFSKLADV